jgi:DNA (cytosine-5)-methyltransferase 1
LAKILRPRAIIFENVPEMDGTLVEGPGGELIELLELLEGSLPDHSGTWRVVEFADYGVPQRRQRLISVFVHHDAMPELAPLSRADRANLLFPEPTHSQAESLFAKPWVTVSDAIGHLPALDAADR